MTRLLMTATALLAQGLTERDRERGAASDA